jgi:SAM-dependent methyltransferase
MTLYASIRKHVSLGAIKDILTTPALWPRLPKFWQSWRDYRRLAKEMPPVRFYPCLDDAQSTQSGQSYYFYQDCWAAKQVFRERPEWLVDVGSTVLLVGILSQFVKAHYIDIRPLDTHLENLKPVASSILDLPYSDNEVPCLTTMCVLEHVGLGRYGDPLNPNGTVEAAQEIARVIRPGGVVVFSVPVGRSVLEFNANRRFTWEQSLALFPGWQTIDSCVLSPIPQPYISEANLLEMQDPVGCFALRKP